MQHRACSAMTYRQPRPSVLRTCRSVFGSIVSAITILPHQALRCLDVAQPLTICLLESSHVHCSCFRNQRKSLPWSVYTSPFFSCENCSPKFIIMNYMCSTMLSWLWFEAPSVEWEDSGAAGLSRSRTISSTSVGHLQCSSTPQPSWKSHCPTSKSAQASQLVLGLCCSPPPVGSCLLMSLSLFPEYVMGFARPASVDAGCRFPGSIGCPSFSGGVDRNTTGRPKGGPRRTVSLERHGDMFTELVV